MGDISKVVRIECQGAGTVAIDNLLAFQGDLKTLSEENYRKLRDEIIRDGFSEPISVWRKVKRTLPDMELGEYETFVEFYVLNGHQRLSTLERMREDGWDIPEIPVSFIDAPDEKAAKRKVLSLTSNYGTMTDDGLVGFIKESDLDFKDIQSSFVFPEVDFDLIAPRFNIAPIGKGGGVPDPGIEETPIDDPDDVIPAPPLVPKSKLGDIYFLDPYFECESCGTKFDYELGKTMKECPCG